MSLQGYLSLLGFLTIFAFILYFMAFRQINEVVLREYIRHTKKYKTEIVVVSELYWMFRTSGKMVPKDQLMTSKGNNGVRRGNKVDAYGEFTSKDFEIRLELPGKEIHLLKEKSTINLLYYKDKYIGFEEVIVDKSQEEEALDNYSKGSFY